jgi:hypothetical protein
LKIFKKSNFTLLEVIIALFLTSILLIALLNFFVRTVFFEKKIETLKKEVFKKEHLQIRLSNIFSHINKSFENYFYTEKEKNTLLSLYLTFNNGIDPDPSFSGPVFGKIYIDQNDLKLTIYPLNEAKQRTETLFQDVKKLEFLFFTKEKNFEWQNNWPQEKQSLPSMLKLKINEESFAFFMPTKNILITYYKK